MIFILRHGERADNCGPEEFNKIECLHDPHLTEFGKIQAQAAGKTLQSFIQESYEKGYLETRNPQIVMVSSPFLRCIQTASHILDTFEPKDIYQGSIFIDEGVSEYLGKEFYDKDPLDELYIRTRSKEDIRKYTKYNLVDGFLEFQIYSSKATYPENHETFFRRVQEGYRNIVEHFNNNINKDKTKVLVILTHGLGTKGMLSCHLENQICRKTDYTCISQVRYNPLSKGNGTILRELYRDHLDLIDIKEKTVLVA
jgi:Fructose-2,6-bisphosphatase